MFFMQVILLEESGEIENGTESTDEKGKSRE
jgi:hypothetical protein